MAPKYDLLEEIGSGGMAKIHRARQCGKTGFERFVAIKRILPELADRPNAVERFIREAQIGSELEHANIVKIFDFGRTKRGYFIVMEHLEGWSANRLSRAIGAAGATIPVPVALSLLHDLAGALEHVHTRTGRDSRPLDIVHRDVSLGNLFVTKQGSAKLIDFGIASCRRHALASDSMLGKPAYMAPEALRGLSWDARVDIYGIGVVAWELLVGRRCFGGHDEEAIVRDVLNRVPDPPSRFRPDCPEALDAVVLGALTKDAWERTHSAAEVRAQLRRIIRDAYPDATPKTVASWIAAQRVIDGDSVDHTLTMSRPLERRAG